MIELHCFEVLDHEGNVYLDNLRHAKASMKYTFAREGTVTYHPHFTYMGFQYAQIVSWPGEAKKENFTACTLHSEMERTGNITCSNPLLNQLHHNYLWGLKGNFLDVPTDCPQRDERLGWTGDAQIFCRTACYLMNTYTFYKKWLRDVEADQTPEGGVSHVVPNIEEGSYFGATPNDLTCTAYYAYSTGIFAKMARVLGKEETAREYEELYSHIAEKFQRTFFKDDGTMTAQTQTAHIVALYFKLVPQAYVKKTVKGLKRLLDKENGHLVTGFVGTPYFCHALSQNGCVKEAYDLLLKEDFPSWLYQVKMGATTVWEHWDGIKPDGSMWSPDMNSFNHYAYGAIGEWMYRVMAGIETDEACTGFKHAVFYPRIGGGLQFVDGTYHSIYGEEGVRWETEDDKVILTVRIPANTTASVRLDEAEEVLEADSLSFVQKNSYMEAEAGSGTYRILFKRRKQH